jgi:multidrug resistance protein MdtO
MASPRPEDGAVRWEWNLLAFLRRELAPSPARWRAALRTTLTAVIASGLIMVLHAPEGEFLLVTLFVLMPADAGASLDKARLRAAGTLGAGAIALVALVLVSDKPWLFLPIQALVIAVAMFFARTTTAPYAFVLGAVTFVLILPLYPSDPSADLERLLWRTALTTLGVLMATGAQLLLWPDDPEVLLLDDLAGRVRDTESLLALLRAVPPGERLAPVQQGVAVTGVSGQLDLLKNAEARSRWLRQRHTEQIALITSVQLLTTAGRRLAQLAGAHPLPGWAAPRIDRIRDACAAARLALAERRTMDVGVAPPVAALPHAASDTELEVAAALEELERAFTRLPAATGFLTQGTTTTATAPAPLREPVAEQRLLTPACTLANADAIRFALKVALATTICGVFLEATNLSGLGTSLITCAVMAQSFIGAGLRKALLRLSGALAGTVVTLVVILVLIPNMETLASYLVMATVTFGLAAWVVAGSSRIGYVGLQMALVLALTLVQSTAPTIDLGVPADRILGILLGILVMGLVDVSVWPVFGDTALRRTLAEALGQMAELHRVAASGNLSGMRQRALGVYRALGEALAMHDDLGLDPGRGQALAAHDALLRVVSGVERLFMDLLAVARHRPVSVPPAVETSLERLDSDTSGAIETLRQHLLGAAPLETLPTAERLDELRTAPELRGFARLYTLAFKALGSLADDLAALARAAGPVTVLPMAQSSRPSSR